MLNVAASSESKSPCEDPATLEPETEEGSAMETERISFAALVFFSCAPRSWSTKLVPRDASLFKRLGGGGGGGGGAAFAGGGGGAAGGQFDVGIGTCGTEGAGGGPGAVREGLAVCCESTCCTAHSMRNLNPGMIVSAAAD
ncbi:unnamed protein product [Haemonchus placei]|uniref:Uncharacterized protein n=1 Tax=Haemonchus placei TaxID=6290 RepID=A0A3P7U845_HAEPC|nr:unnamed protein product [Haemonchus placei]